MVLYHLSYAFVQVSSAAIAQRQHMPRTLLFSNDRKQAHDRAIHKLCLPGGVDMLVIDPRHHLQALLGDSAATFLTSQGACALAPGA